MRMSIIARHGVGLATLFFISACAPQSEQSVETGPSAAAHTIYLVRHAEKEKGDEPGLTPQGLVRANALRNRLQGQNVKYLHSSNYRRTLETAAPLARALNMEVQIYDPNDLPGLAKHIQTLPGTHVVIGHSNTTPELAALLSGDGIIPMSDDEYDRIYEISLNAATGLSEAIISTYGDGMNGE